MQHGHDTCMFETSMLTGSRSGTDLTRLHQEELGAGFGARPHWGLHRELRVVQNRDDLRAFYPGFDEWEAVYRQLNRGGAFNNWFTDALGISV